MTTQFTKGSRVSFLPGPRSRSRVSGTVTATGAGANGHFLEVQCDDRTEPRLIRPGACTAG